MAYNKEDNSELRALQMAELRLMKILVGICEKHGLRYFMIGGTMLGAVRHKGFIPWDDDMDVGMPRKDYERLIEIVCGELPEGCSFLNYREDADYKRYFSRIVDDSIVVTNASYTQTIYENAWVDIFPIDGTPKSWLGCWLHFWKMMFMRFLYCASCFEELVNLNRPNRKWYLKLVIRFLQVTHFGANWDTKKMLDRIDKRLRKYPYDGSKYGFCLFGAYMTREIMPLTIVGDCADYPFEDAVFKGPAQYDAFLKRLYGDYMTPPKDVDKDKHNIEKIETVERKAG